MSTQTAKELAEMAKQAKPNVRYAYSANDSTVAAWAEDHWTPVAGRSIIDGRWFAFQCEVLVNGKRVTDNLEFIEV